MMLRPTYEWDFLDCIVPVLYSTVKLVLVSGRISDLSFAFEVRKNQNGKSQ